MMSCKMYSLSILVISITVAFVGSVDQVKRVDDEELTRIITKPLDVLVLYCEESFAEQCIRVQQQLNNVLDESTVQGLSAVVAFDSLVVKNYQFKSLPQLVYYRSGRPILYYADETNNVDLTEWVERNQASTNKQLNEDNFEHDTQASSGATTGDWFIMFYDSTECGWLIPTWEALASKMKNKLVVGSVDTKANKKLYARLKLHKCLTLLFLRHGSMYEYNLHTKDLPSLASFADGWYKNVPAVKVPTEPSPFDQLTDNIANFLKEKMGGQSNVIIGGVCSVLLLVSFIVCSCVIANKKEEKTKKE